MGIAVYDSLTNTLLRAIASKLNASCQGIKIRIGRQMTGGEEGVVIYINDMQEELINKSALDRTYQRSYVIGLTYYNQTSLDKTLTEESLFDAVFNQLDSIDFNFNGVDYRLFIASKEATSENFPALVLLSPYDIIITKKDVMPEIEDGLAENLYIKEILEV